jgi:tetratricopeptide (TPR) repeat protein
VECLYENLRARGITYRLEPLRLEDPNNTKQDIRTPADVKNQGGTCLDLALLFAALCLEVRLLPMVVLLGGDGADSDHALVVVDLNYDAAQWEQPRGLKDIYRKEGLIADKQAKAFVLEQIKQNKWVAVEAIGFAEIPRISFDEACAKGEERITHRAHVATLDIAALQAKGETPFELIEDRLAELVDQIALKKNVPAAPLREVLAKLGEVGVANYDIHTRLDAAANELIELRAQLARLSNERPDLAAIREKALALIDRGDLDQARATLSGGREAARALREEASRNEAELLADEARIDHLQLAYRIAAEKYAEAAALVAPFDPDRQWTLLMRGASALYNQGLDFGDNEALKEAIDTYNLALALHPRAISPVNWAATQYLLGKALVVLGGRAGDRVLLKQAVAACREALKERTRNRRPLEWAATQDRLGAALFALGVCERGTTRLNQAVVAYSEALKERTRERVPLDWAATQANLGGALYALSRRENGTTRLKQAVAACREALKERTRQCVPLDWAATQHNLAIALSALGRLDVGTARLKQAITACHEALEERTRSRLPLAWAETHYVLGGALQALGEREPGTETLEKAVEAYREALKEQTRQRLPLKWAAAQNNLGTTLHTLGKRENSTKKLEEAVAAFHASLTIRTRDRVPLDWAETYNNLGAVLQTLGQRDKRAEKLEEAVVAYCEALKERTRVRVPLDWAMTQNNLGAALQALGEREGGTEKLEKAVAAYRGALKIYKEAGASSYIEHVRRNLARAERLLIDRQRSRRDLTRH